MIIWEISNFADPITMVSEDFRAVVGAALILGQGNYGVREFKRRGSMRQCPVMRFWTAEGAENWFKETFPDTMPNALGYVDGFIKAICPRSIARVLRTTQLCRPEERLSYQKALEAIDDPAKKQAYVNWWHEERENEASDITGLVVKTAWLIAEQLEQRAAKQERESGQTQSLAS